MQPYCDTMSQSEPDTHVTLPAGRTLSYLLTGADSGPVVTVLDVTVVPGVEQIGLLVIFEEALRFATFTGP